MLCPEGSQFQTDILNREDTGTCKNTREIPFVEGTGGGGFELKSYKNPKTWKKSISNFFRNQLRSSKSNDGDGPSGSKKNCEEKEFSPEQKWQSLGKIFRRQSFAEHCNKSPNQEGESSQNKRLAVRKVLSSYFGKNPKSLSVVSNEK